jgi:O-antigen ligase
MNNALKIFFFLLVFLLPSYLIKIKLTNQLSLPLLDFFSLGFIFLAILKISSLYTFAELRKVFSLLSLLPFVLVILGFFCAYLINFQTQDWQTGAGILKSFLFLPILSAFCFKLFHKKRILSLTSFALPLFLSTGIVSLLGYIFTITGNLTYDGRLTLFFESPNQLAVFLSIGLLCTIFLLTTNKFGEGSPKGGKFFLFLLLALGFFQLFSLFMTQSLGALVALLIAVSLVIFKKQLVAFTRVILLLVLVLSGSIFFINALLHIIDYKQAVPATSTDSRIAIYLVAHKIISENYLSGIGPGNFQKKYLEFQKFFPPFPQWAVPHAHNNILHFWSEGGLFALIGFLLLVLLLIKTKKQTSQEIFVYSVILYFLIHGIVDTTIWKNDLAVIFWLFAVFALSKSDPIEISALSIRKK